LVIFADTSALLKHLEGARGDVRAQRELIKEIINESLRFKRKRMAAELECFLSKLCEGPINGQAAS